VIGVGANVLGGKVTSKFIPNFAWVDDKKYDWDKFVETAKKIMARRKKELSKEQETLLLNIYKA